MGNVEDVAIRKNRQGLLVRAARCEAQIVAGPEPEIHVYREGWRLMRLPAVSGLAGVDAAECLTDIQLEPLKATGDGIRLALTDRSSLWGERHRAHRRHPRMDVGPSAGHLERVHRRTAVRRVTSGTGVRLPLAMPRQVLASPCAVAGPVHGWKCGRRHSRPE
jgi:hypothetical protein